MAPLIVGLSGSPRAGGNTDDAVQAVLACLQDEHGLETEFVALSGIHLERCRGCRQCMTLNRCANTEDDLGKVLAAIEPASGLVIGSPVYWWSPPGLFKDFMDRTHGWFLEGELFAGKPAVILSIAADSGFEAHEQPIEVWLAHYGAHLVTKERIYAREVGDFRQRPEQQAKAQRAAVAVAEALSS